jgi:hypothetical protein
MLHQLNFNRTFVIKIILDSFFTGMKTTTNIFIIIITKGTVPTPVARTVLLIKLSTSRSILERQVHIGKKT